MPSYVTSTVNMGDARNQNTPVIVTVWEDPSEFRRPLEIHVFIGDDGATVVQIDTTIQAHEAEHDADRLRINVNDAPVFDQGVETGTIYPTTED